MLRSRIASFIPYILLIAFLVGVSAAGSVALDRLPHLADYADLRVFVLAGLLFVAYLINRIAPRTVIPSFVWAVFAGLALQPFLAPFTGDVAGLKTVVEVCAAIVLFAGGLEIPFKNFRRWFLPIASLSLLGVVVSAVIFAVIVHLMMKYWFGFEPSLLPSIVILSAALASTDPTAIIPTLKSLRLKRDFLKQIAISESALTDVSGSVLTRFLLLALLGAVSVQGSVLELFAPIFQKSSYDALALQIVSGVVIGYLGHRLITFFYARDPVEGKHEDPALLLAIPVFTFTLGNILGGAGFLAAFVAGLLSEVRGSMREAAKFYDSFLNHLVKPFVFIVLGALVPIGTLITLAPLGIVAALAFMFIVRPLAVFVSLAPWLARSVFTFRDLLFLSFIRETGIIAAVLLIIAASHAAVVPQFMIAVGIWVILLTLLIEPPLTPWVAKKIGLAAD